MYEFQADLRLADFRAKQRAMEDALMALEVNMIYSLIPIINGIIYKIISSL